MLVTVLLNAVIYWYSPCFRFGAFISGNRINTELKKLYQKNWLNNTFRSPPAPAIEMIILDHVVPGPRVCVCVGTSRLGSHQRFWLFSHHPSGLHSKLCGSAVPLCDTTSGMCHAYGEWTLVFWKRRSHLEAPIRGMRRPRKKGVYIPFCVLRNQPRLEF